MKKVLYLSFLLCAMFFSALGQRTHQDSVAKVARKDAKNFKLDNAVWKKYGRTLASGSDYFKPTHSNPDKENLLTDSAYVAAYRIAAFKQNRHRRTPWHYVWVGGTVLAGIAIAGAVAIVLIVGPTMN